MHRLVFIECEDSVAYIVFSFRLFFLFFFWAHLQKKKKKKKKKANSLGSKVPLG